MALAWVYLLLAPALTLATAGLVVAAVLVCENVALCVVLALLAAVALALRLRLASNGARARLLSGNFPYSSVSAPATVDDFAERLRQVWRATGTRPTVVGAGWGFFISREDARRAIFTHNLKGAFKNDYTFLCGTEILQAEKHLHKKFRRTFWSTPTMQRVSIGSWLARSCHGNSGEAGFPSSFAASRVLIIDLTTQATAQSAPRWENYDEVKGRLDQFPGQFVIAAVEFDPFGPAERPRMAENFMLKKSRHDVCHSPHVVDVELSDWLASDAVLRVLFFGSARRHGIGVKYVKFNEARHSVVPRRVCCTEVPHIDPHDCSAACMSLQLDTCSLIGGWFERPKNAWAGIIRLRDANNFSPDPSFLWLPLISALSVTANFELIFVLPPLVAPTREKEEFRIQRLCNSLLALVKLVWGRFEVRVGNVRKGLVFVDCICRARDARTVFKELAKHMHAQIAALHDSKYQGSEITDAARGWGVTLETPRVIFGMS